MVFFPANSLGIGCGEEEGNTCLEITAGTAFFLPDLGSREEGSVGVVFLDTR